MSEVTISIDHVAPPEDVRAVHAPDCVWYEIATDAGSFASVAMSERGRFMLLHWIQSERRGDGHLLLDVFAQVQNSIGFDATAVCEFALCGWYQRAGWTVAGPLHSTGMWRLERRPA